MKHKNSSNTEIGKKQEFLSIHDCLKMIGMKEVTANIYRLPTKKPLKVANS